MTETSKVPAPLVFIDTETTGLDPDVHEVWEVGAIRRLAGQEDEERVWQLPVDLGRADPVALRIGRFHERRMARSRAADGDAIVGLRTFAAELADFTRGAHLVGAVVSFDEERLRKLLRANGACPEWHYHLIDVEALVVGYLRGWLERDDERLELATPPWKSDQLTAALGIEIDETGKHTALGDARWARALYDAVVTS